jgi:hypothetical protein
LCHFLKQVFPKLHPLVGVFNPRRKRPACANSLSKFHFETYLPALAHYNSPEASQKNLATDNSLSKKAQAGRLRLEDVWKSLKEPFPYQT